MEDVAAIEQAEREIAAAHVPLDVATIARLYHPGFVIAQPDGSVETKQQVLDSFGSGERHWQSAEVKDLRVTVAGSTGVALGTWKAFGTNRGVSFDYTARFLSVWTKEDGTWLNLAYQAVEVFGE